MSVDQDNTQWLDFIASHKMVCPQCRDSDNKIVSLFGIDAFPTYIVIDGDGVIQQRIVGTDPQKSVAYHLRKVLAALPRLQ